MDILANAFRDTGIYASSFEEDLGTNANTVPPENPFSDFARFLNPSGVHFMQCRPAAEFFTTFLNQAIDPGSGIIAKRQRMFVREEGRSELMGSRLHRSTYLWFPNYSDPLDLDTTPCNKLHQTPRGEGENQAESESDSPAWLRQVQDRLTKPPTATTRLSARADVSSGHGYLKPTDAKAKLEGALDALIKVIHEGRKRGSIPLQQNVEGTDPIHWSIRAASVALKGLNGEIRIEDALKRIRETDRAFGEMNIQSAGDLLCALGERAERKRLKFESYLQRQISGRYAHYYRNPTLQDSIKALYYALEGLRHYNPGDRFKQRTPEALA